MDTLKHILIWELWLLCSIIISLFLSILARSNARRQRLLVPVLLLLSLSLIGLGGSLVVLPYAFLNFPGGFLCVFGVQLAYASFNRATSAGNEDWPKEALPSSH